MLPPSVRDHSSAPRSHRPLAVTIALLAFLGPATLVPGSAGCARPAPGATPRLADQPDAGLELEALVEELDQPERAQTAASRLVEAAWHDPAVASRIADRLLEASPEARSAIVEAIARVPLAPERLWPVVEARLASTPAAGQPAILQAVASFPTRRTAFTLLAHTHDDHPEPVRRAAFNGLMRLSGRDDLATDREAWQAWYVRSLSISGRAWTLQIMRDRARRAEALDQRASALSRQLAETSRRLYLAHGPERRPTLLAEFLASEVDAVRSLGIELVRQRLASGEPVDPLVSDAALDLLDHARPTVRAEAARLVRQVAPEGAGERVIEALRRERDPRAAEALLAAATRWPDARAREAVFRWLEIGGPPAAVAAELAWRMHQEGLLAEPEAQRRVLDLLRLHDLVVINGAGCRLLVELGNQADHQRVADLLATDRLDLKLNAARALASLPDFVPAIVHAADNDLRLLDTAVRAVREHAPNREGFRLLMGLDPSRSDEVRRALLGLASDLTTPELVAVASDSDLETSFRESMLSILTAPDRLPPEDADEAQRRAYAQGILQLARLRLDLDRPADALSALTNGDGVLGVEAPPEVARLRVEALLRLGRIGEAGEIAGVGIDPWLAALDAAEDAQLILELVQAIEERFADSLTEQQRTTLASAREELDERAAADQSATAPEKPSQPPEEPPDDSDETAPPPGGDEQPPPRGS